MRGEQVGWMILMGKNGCTYGVAFVCEHCTYVDEDFVSDLEVRGA